MVKKKVKRKAVAAPQTVMEAHDYMRRLGELARDIDGYETRMNANIERIKKEALQKVAPLEETLNECAEGLIAYAETHRNQLTDGGKNKTAKFPAGDIAWRMPPTSVRITNTEQVLATLRKRSLARFIRMKPEPDKEAMLRDREAAEKVPGITFSQVEMVVLKPARVNVEFQSRKGKLKRVVPEDKE